MSAVKKWWAAHFLGAELVLATAAAAALIVWAEAFSGAVRLQGLLTENRGYVYSTFATLSGALLGFVLTAMSVVLSFITGPRFERLRGSRSYPYLWRVFSSAVRWLGLSTVVGLAALVIDRDATPCRALFYASFWALAVAAARLGRSVWLVEGLIDALIRAPDARDGTAAP